MILHLKDGIIFLSNNDTKILCENCDIINTLIELDPLTEDIWLPMISCEVIDIAMVYLLWTEFLDLQNIQNKIIEIHYLNIFGILEYYLPMLIDEIKNWSIKDLSTRQDFLAIFNDEMYYQIISYLPSNIADKIPWSAKYIKIYLFRGDPKKLYENGYPSLAYIILNEYPDKIECDIYKFLIIHNHIKLFYYIPPNLISTWTTEENVLLMIQNNHVKMLKYVIDNGINITTDLMQKMEIYASVFKSYDVVSYLKNLKKLKRITLSEYY
jgi:hypothetical protein